MDLWWLVILLKPFFLLGFLFFTAVAALYLKRIWPQWAFREVLFDRTFRDRHPLAFTYISLGVFFGIIAGLAVATQLMGLMHG